MEIMYVSAPCGWVYGHFEPSCFSLDLDRGAVAGIGLSESGHHICLALAMASRVATPWVGDFGLQ